MFSQQRDNCTCKHLEVQLTRRMEAKQGQFPHDEARRMHYLQSKGSVKLVHHVTSHLLSASGHTRGAVCRAETRQT